MTAQQLDPTGICAPDGGHSLAEIIENPYTVNPAEVRWLASGLAAALGREADLQRRLDARAADLGRFTQATVTGIKALEGDARKALHAVRSMTADLAARGVHVGLGPPGDTRCVTCHEPWPCPIMDPRRNPT